MTSHKNCCKNLNYNCQYNQFYKVHERSSFLQHQKHTRLKCCRKKFTDRIITASEIIFHLNAYFQHRNKVQMPQYILTASKNIRPKCYWKKFTVRILTALEIILHLNAYFSTKKLSSKCYRKKFIDRILTAWKKVQTWMLSTEDKV